MLTSWAAGGEDGCRAGCMVEGVAPGRHNTLSPSAPDSWLQVERGRTHLSFWGTE